MKKLFYQLSVQTKMFLVIVMGLLGFAVYFVVNFSILKSNSDSLQRVVNEQLPAVSYSSDIINNLATYRAATSQAVISQNFEGLGSAEFAHKAISESFKKWQEGNLPRATEVEALGKKYKEQQSKLNEITQNIVAGIATLHSVQGQVKDSISTLNDIEKEMKTIKQKIDEDLRGSVANANLLSRTAIGVGFGILVAAILATIIFVFVTSDINRSLTGANETLQMASSRLLEMVDEAQVSSSQLRETSNRQASSSTETVVSMEQIKRLLSQTSRTSGSAVELSEASFQEANGGKEIVQALRDAMTEIDRSNTALEEVNQVVRLIRDRTNVINEIVFKTQMLSFNANIEAARAGQHGLGFAVVANEMGSLAEMSGKAAQQINELLDKSAEQVETTVVNTKERITKANDLSARCYEFFKLLTDRSGELKRMVDSISSAAAEQNSGVDYVVNAMNDLNNTAAESDRMAQGISMLADGLKTQVLNLTTAVNSLNSLVSGQNKDGFDMDMWEKARNGSLLDKLSGIRKPSGEKETPKKSA
jgi:methyl-accepting chemotaxis protein